jgi:hypothetical protein
MRSCCVTFILAPDRNGPRAAMLDPQDKSYLSAGLRSAFLALILLLFFRGQTISLDPSIGDFNLLRTARYFTR